MDESNNLKMLMEQLRAFFPMNKLRSNLFKYLSANYGEENERLTVGVFNNDSGIIENTDVGKGDVITLVKLVAIQSHEVDFICEATIAIANFHKNYVSADLFEVEKCLARMRYNECLEIFDIEFYINEVNKKRP